MYRMKNIKRNVSTGFTLIELLATISILSLISVIVIAVSVNLLDETKEKSFAVSINEVQNGAVAYVAENYVSIRNWREYVGEEDCTILTVQQLIDKGFFDSDILGTEVSFDGTKIDAIDNILVVRNSSTKTVTMSKLIHDPDDSILGDCGDLIEPVDEVTGAIRIEVAPSGTNWVNDGRNIEVTYILDGVSESDLSNYTYYYELPSGTSSRNDFDNDTEIADFFAREEGSIYTEIRNKTSNEVIVSKTYDLAKIDREAPVINLSLADGGFFVSVVEKPNDDNSGINSNYDINYLLTTENINSCAALNANSLHKTVDGGTGDYTYNSGTLINIIDYVALDYTSSPNYTLYVCSDNLKDNAGNSYEGIVKVTIPDTEPEGPPSENPTFPRGDYECTQSTTSMAMFASSAGSMMDFVNNNMVILPSGTEFCYLKHEYVNLVGADGGWSSDWPFVSAYVLKSYVNSSNIPAENLEVVEGVEYVFGYIPLQNGGMCLTSLPCPGMAQFGIAP